MSEPELTLDDRQRLEEEFVAYLDGELDADASRRVEERLATDASVRQELHRLERSWQLLERLPRAEVDESFTQSTIEMLAVKAAEDLEKERAREPRRQSRRLAAAAAVALIAIALGYTISRWQWPDPNEQLVRDLPVLENLDQYRQIENIEFLRQLHEQGLFKDEEKRVDEKQ